LELNFFLKEKLPSGWSNHAGMVVCIAGQFAWYLALNETPAVKATFLDVEIFTHLKRTQIASHYSPL